MYFRMNYYRKDHRWRHDVWTPKRYTARDEVKFCEFKSDLQTLHLTWTILGISFLYERNMPLNGYAFNHARLKCIAYKLIYHQPALYHQIWNKPCKVRLFRPSLYSTTLSTIGTAERLTAWNIAVYFCTWNLCNIYTKSPSSQPNTIFVC